MLQGCSVDLGMLRFSRSRAGYLHFNIVHPYCNTAIGMSPIGTLFSNLFSRIYRAVYTHLLPLSIPHNPATFRMIASAEITRRFLSLV